MIPDYATQHETRPWFLHPRAGLALSVILLMCAVPHISAADAAHEFVATALMLSEANTFAEKVGLPEKITARDVQPGSHVGPSRSGNFSGSILTPRHFFGFWQGHLANFYQRGFMPSDESGIRQRNAELAKLTSRIDTNAAYQLATNWLASTGVDTAALQQKYKLNFVQWRYYPEGTDAPAVLLPVYQIEWLGLALKTQPSRERAAASVTVSGVAGELVQYHVQDDSLFLRPRMQIKDTEKLLSIADGEFQKFDVLQRSNLLVQFLGANLARSLSPAGASPPADAKPPGSAKSFRPIQRKLQTVPASSPQPEGPKK